mgnify:FL=1
MVEGYTYEFYRKAAGYIKERLLKDGRNVPVLAVVLGTGCAPFAERLKNRISIPYGDIPGFPTTTNPSHKGELVVGSIGGAKGNDIICMNGRMHFYEGYSMEELNIPVHVLHVLGVKTLVLTNAAGSCNPRMKPGDAVVIKDHIKLYGGSPMRGPNVPELGPRFFSVKDIYTKSLRTKALELAANAGLRVHEGVYMFFPGPQFETASEIRAAQILGADIVGMSTVTEALTAAHCGMKLFGLALVSNMATGVYEYDSPAKEANCDIEEVDEVDEVDVVAAKASESFSSYLEAVVTSFIETKGE